MLQQMGWEEGKGLGAKEDGNTTHVRISRKKDNSGEREGGGSHELGGLGAMRARGRGMGWEPRRIGESERE